MKAIKSQYTMPKTHKLGHIDDITQDELKAILGGGNVTVTLSN